MKKILVVLICAMALGLSATTVSALPIVLDTASPYYLGAVIPSLPAGTSLEESYIDRLTSMAVNTSYPDPLYNPSGSGENNFFRSGRYPAPATFPAADWVSKDEGAPVTNPFDATGYYYILAKYGQGNANDTGAYVWYAPNGFVGEVMVPTVWVGGATGGGLSHVSLFNYEPNLVPDGGFTLMLLGGALVGLGALRRKFRA